VSKGLKGKGTGPFETYIGRFSSAPGAAWLASRQLKWYSAPLHF